MSEEQQSFEAYVAETEESTKALQAAQEGAAAQQTPEQPQSAEPVQTPEAQPEPVEDAPLLFEVKEEEAEAIQKGLAPEDLNRYGQEVLQNNGQLTEASYKEITEKTGLDKSFVDQYVQGQVALAQQQTAKVAEAAGGMDVVNAALKWAENLPEGEKTQINSSLAASDEYGQITILRDLVARSGAGRSAVVGEASQALGATPFMNREDYQNALLDPKYDTDPVYRDTIMKRLQASKQSGSIK